MRPAPKVAHPQPHARPTPDESGVVRVPYEAISRPLADRPNDSLSTGFIAEQRLADLLFRRRIRRCGPGLISCDETTYEIYEAVQVLGPMHGQGDPYGLGGVVEHIEALTKAGASFAGTTMHIGSAVYRVARGVVAIARPAGMAG